MSRRRDCARQRSATASSESFGRRGRGFERHRGQRLAQVRRTRAGSAIDDLQRQTDRSPQLIDIDRKAFVASDIDFADRDDDRQLQPAQLLQQPQLDREFTGVDHDTEQVGPSLRVPQLIHGNALVAAARSQRRKARQVDQAQLGAANLDRPLHPFDRRSGEVDRPL